MIAKLLIDDWHGCYDEGWKGMIVDEAFAHPAKISYALAARIYEHAFKAGWLKPGDTVVDPFGGICGTALHAAIQGVRWVGCELEPKFHQLGNQNIDLWQRQYGTYPEWVRPTLHCGDSRRLCEVLGMADVCVSSPPFVECLHGSDGNKSLAASGVKADGTRRGGAINDTYGQSPGQLGGMKEGSIDQSKLTGNKAGKNSQAKAEGYGDSDGQLSSMVVGSPPFEGSLDRGVVGAADRVALAREMGISNAEFVSPIDMEKIGKRNQEYGATAGNIGNDTGETFWSASRLIVEQCHTILRPGGVAIWVCKDFVRKGERVPFSDQWLALCEAIGFRLVCRHRAMLVKVNRQQRTLDGGIHETRKERKSFFRRLAEKKGSPRIDWEDVICVQKLHST